MKVMSYLKPLYKLYKGDGLLGDLPLPCCSHKMKMTLFAFFGGTVLGCAIGTVASDEFHALFHKLRDTVGGVGGDLNKSVGDTFQKVKDNVNVPQQEEQ